MTLTFSSASAFLLFPRFAFLRLSVGERLHPVRGHVHALVRHEVRAELSMLVLFRVVSYAVTVPIFQVSPMPQA
jgi:hypothetical protein